MAQNTGDAIKDFTGDDNISKYFAKFCSDKYKEVQDYVKEQLDKADEGEGTAQCLPTGCKQPIMTHLPILQIHIAVRVANLSSV